MLRRRSCLGLTLIEVAVSIALLAFLAAGIFSAVLQLRRTSEALVREEIATSVAGGFMEQLRAVDYPELLRLANVGGSLELVIQNNLRINVAINTTDWTEVLVPLTTNADGEIENEMPFDFQLFLQDMAPLRSIVLRVVFRWQDVLSGNNRERELVLLRSAVPR
jgi:type II secretory pathway pseudopilin PulG